MVYSYRGYQTIENYCDKHHLEPRSPGLQIQLEPANIPPESLGRRASMCDGSNVFSTNAFKLDGL
jgi:hypothetical protein